MVEYNKLLYEIAVRFAANYLFQAKRAQTARIKERSQMLECYEFIAVQAKRATEQRFRLKPASVYPVICMDRYNIRVKSARMRSKYIQHFITNKPGRACEIVHLQQFTREYSRGREGEDWVTIDTFPHCRMFLWHFY